MSCLVTPIQPSVVNLVQEGNRLNLKFWYSGGDLISSCMDSNKVLEGGGQVVSRGASAPSLSASATDKSVSTSLYFSQGQETQCTHCGSLLCLLLCFALLRGVGWLSLNMIGWLGKWESIPNSELFIHLLGRWIDKQVLFRHNNVVCLLNCCVGLLQLPICDYTAFALLYCTFSVVSIPFHSGLEQRLPWLPGLLNGLAVQPTWTL